MDPLPRNLAEAAHAEGRQDWLTSVSGGWRVSALSPMAPAAV